VNIAGFAIDPATPGTVFLYGDRDRRELTEYDLRRRRSRQRPALQDHERRCDLGARQHRARRPGVSTLAVDPGSSATIYALTSRDGIYRSTDGGTTWSPFNTRLTTDHVLGLAFAGASVPYAATWQRIFKLVGP
jgi:hypothetical protein